MIYSIDGNVGSTLVTTDFDIVVQDTLDGNKYRIGITAQGEVYSELSTAEVKDWVFQDIISREFFKVLTINGEVQVELYTAIAGDLSAVHAKLDQLLECACPAENGTNLPFKMYGIE